MFDEFKKRLKSTESLISMALGLAVILLIGALTFKYYKSSAVPAKQLNNSTENGNVNPTASNLPNTHVVQTDETLWSISESYYKTGYNWVDIQKANAIADPDHIEVGESLNIPVVTPIMPEGNVTSGTSDIRMEKKSYTIVSGDTLWDIAVKNYSDGYKWVAIAEENKLTNPDLIYAGNVLILP